MAQNSPADSTERSPLLPKALSSNSHSSSSEDPNATSSGIVSTGFSPLARLFLTVLLLAISFSLTATTLLFAIKEILCNIDEREDGGKWSGEGERCSSSDLEARTAQAVSAMAAVTTFAGVLNLLITGWMTKRWGVRAALVAQTAFPALRVACQAYAVWNDDQYSLTSNTYANELVIPEERTVAFGRLQGVQMAGTAIGLFVGGLLGAKVAPVAPFLGAFILLSLSTILSGCFLPYIPPAAEAKTTDGKAARSIGPVRVFLPRCTENGGRFYGLFFLAIGGFLSVFATSFIPLLLQLYGTNRFGFRPDINGYLMTLTSLSRAVFLTVLFPRIIASGRRWYSPSSAVSQLPTDPAAASEEHLPAPFAEIEPVEPLVGVDPLAEAAPPAADSTAGMPGIGWDLVFLRLSILVDALLVALLPFSREGWQLFVAAGVLPLASGTAPTAKGVALEMVKKEEQADALQGIALNECVAMMLTISASGWIFSILSESGQANLTFFVNAGTALLAFLILLLVRFPPAALSNRSSA
ncbi:hypothetical protein JCM8547_001417 [Rhodosporidiobolus lusitaniae]